MWPKEPTDRLSWPIAGIGRILSPRSIAAFDGEQVGHAEPETGGRDRFARNGIPRTSSVQRVAHRAILRNEKVSLTTTLITKLLTNPLAQSRST